MIHTLLPLGIGRAAGRTLNIHNVYFMHTSFNRAKHLNEGTISASVQYKRDANRKKIVKELPKLPGCDDDENDQSQCMYIIQPNTSSVIKFSHH